jgi:hypothetical protein
MWPDRGARTLLLVVALASCADAAWADTQPPLPPPEPAPQESAAFPHAEHATDLEIEPPEVRPPWSGREAIWGGVGLIIAGTLTVIVVAPALCTSSLFSAGGAADAGTPSTGPSPRTTCVEATLGSGAGGVGLGVILLAVGETQRSTYKAWLRSHPMFGGLSLTPSTRGPAVGWTLSF